jgi:hypothetical protein
MQKTGGIVTERVGKNGRPGAISHQLSQLASKARLLPYILRPVLVLGKRYTSGVPAMHSS